MQKYSKEKSDADCKAIVNKIIPFSNVDGPGNRLVVFFQGCNARCIYCHNPETMGYCQRCFKCIEVCPQKALSCLNGKVEHNESLCISCDACIRVCPHHASPRTKIMGVDELYEEIKAYSPYIRGVTVSGGEPLLNYNFVIKLFKKIKRESGLSCFVDTNGFFDKREMDKLIEITDKFMLDIKSVDKVRELCGIESKDSIDNLKYLLKQDKVFEVRTVIVDEMDAEATVSKVAFLLKDYQDVNYKLIRVHTTGLNESRKERIKHKIPNNEKMEQIRALALEKGAKKVECIL